MVPYGPLGRSVKQGGRLVEFSQAELFLWVRQIAAAQGSRQGRPVLRQDVLGAARQQRPLQTGLSDQGPSHHSAMLSVADQPT